MNSDREYRGGYRVIGSLEHDCYPPITLRFKGRVVQCAECGQYYLSSTDWLGYFVWKKRSRRWVRRHFPEEGQREQ